MKAVVLDEFGTDPVLRSVPRPVPAAGEVLVRVVASGVNPLDTKIRAGAAAHARVTPPMILGIDLAGVVTEVGPGVTGFAVGDEVYGMTGGVGGAATGGHHRVGRAGRPGQHPRRGPGAGARRCRRRRSRGGATGAGPRRDGVRDGQRGEPGHDPAAGRRAGRLQAATLADAGLLTPLVDPAAYYLETVADAYRAVETGKSAGKVVVQVSPADR